MSTAIHYFGIRHHGPGSASRLVAALNQLQPAIILIEGPSDCTKLLPLLADSRMVPPVALLAYIADKPDCKLYYPFTDYSPEYQACCWASAHHHPVHLIDLPVNVQLAQIQMELEAKDIAGDSKINDEDEDANWETDIPKESHQIVHDPIGILAKHAGYEDGEAWWNDLIEQNGDNDQDIFNVVETAMQTLRDQIPNPPAVAEREQQREAYMRLEITNLAKNTDGPIAVVCGAWHVPALKQKHTTKDDRAILKTLPTKLASSKIKTTWIPWTSPRLANASGYGAGVDAPMWYQHLWQYREQPDIIERWLTTTAHALRENGFIVSTASIIEAVRLSISLAAVRNRPAPAFEEIREAVIACLCFGEHSAWQYIEQKMLLGNQVGEIPPNSPLVPLLEDLQQQQKKNKLKPEALERELSLDLRSASGLGKSILLHRLTILEIPWGSITDTGSSRGTFRERWRLCWQPEFAVQLVENLIYGSTIEQAANTKMHESFANETHLNKLADMIQLCLESQLNRAADIGLNKLQERAAHTSDCIELLESLPSLINVSRYGTAREISLAHIEELILHIATQTALALPYACRNLNDEEGQHYRQCLSSAHQSLELAELDDNVMESWWQALIMIVTSPQSNLFTAGLSARLLYQAQKLSVNELQDILYRTLSPAVPAADAARFFEGFFSDAVERLLYDQLLLKAIEDWLIQLTAEEFVEYLPLFRRIFSGLDAMERKRMLDVAIHGREQSRTDKAINPATLLLWPEHLQRLKKLFDRNKEWTQ